mmetsp:Transcript_37603/g.91393  ORF Transcript_37603/g.91393 Transcript_37603/m.91393 type:complete len:505 (-) Transcript_37603:106-1620(-)
MAEADLLQKNRWDNDGTSFSTAQAVREADNKHRGEDGIDDINDKTSLTGSTVNTTLKTYLTEKEQQGDKSTAKLQHVLFSTTTQKGSRGRTASTSTSTTTTATEASTSTSSVAKSKPIWTVEMDLVQPWTAIVNSNEEEDGQESQDDPSLPPFFDEFFDKNKNSGNFSSSPTCAEDIDDFLSFYMLTSMNVNALRRKEPEEGEEGLNNSTTDQEHRTDGGELSAGGTQDETTPKMSNRRRISQRTSLTASLTRLSATAAKPDTKMFNNSNSNSNTTIHDDEKNGITLTPSSGEGRDRRVTNNVCRAADDEKDALMFVGKRIEVQWMMSDGQSEWFAGTVVENDGQAAIIEYDDGDNGSIQNGSHPQHVGGFQLWRTVTATLELPELSSTTNRLDVQPQIQQRKVYGGWPVSSSWKKKKVSMTSSDSTEKKTMIYPTKHKKSLGGIVYSDSKAPSKVPSEAETKSTTSEYEMEVARRRKRQKYGSKWACRRWPPKCLIKPKTSSL